MRIATALAPRRATQLAAALFGLMPLAALSLAQPPAALALPKVALQARFQPDRLGASTTIHYGFTISTPAPLRTLTIRLPPGMGFARSSIGIEPCPLSRLTEFGPEGCPADSLLGFGFALAEVHAQSTVREKATVTAVLGQPDGENMTILFFVDGQWPVRQEIVLTAHLLQIASRTGARLITQAPPLPVWPGGPAVGLISFNSTIGPQGITYYRTVHGHRVGFVPRGVSVPEHCPHKGFAIRATFTWWGLSGAARAKTYVPCPAGGSGPRRRKAAA